MNRKEHIRKAYKDQVKISLGTGVGLKESPVVAIHCKDIYNFLSVVMFTDLKGGLKMSLEEVLEYSEFSIADLVGYASFGMLLFLATVLLICVVALVIALKYSTTAINGSNKNQWIYFYSALISVVGLLVLMAGFVFALGDTSDEFYEDFKHDYLNPYFDTLEEYTVLLDNWQVVAESESNIKIAIIISTGRVSI